MSDPAHPPLPHPGLTPAQVEESRRLHGTNALTPPERDPWWKQFLSGLRDGIVLLLRSLVFTVPLFLAGFLAITGSPPFGPFVSEFTMVNAAFLSGHFVAGGLFLVLLGIVFIGMGATVLTVVQGVPAESTAVNGYRDNFATCAPILLFMALVLLLGLYIPPPLEALLRDAAAFLEGRK